MKYTDRSTSSSITRRINIEDGPVLPMAYSSTGKTFRVDHVDLPYVMTEDGTWQILYAVSIDVSGTVLKKDGSDGQNRHSRWPTGCTSRYNEPVRFEGEWEWVGQLIDAARPEGTVIFPPLERVDLDSPGASS